MYTVVEKPYFTYINLMVSFGFLAIFLYFLVLNYLQHHKVVR